MGRQRWQGRDSRKPALPERDDKPGVVARALSRVLEGSGRLQRPAVRAYLDRLRTSRPDATPADIVTTLEKRYLTAVTASGAAIGSWAALPGIGTLVALSASAGETAVFLEATALFTLAVAEVHGIPADRKDQRRALVLAVLAGDDSRRAVTDLLGTGRTGGAWLSEGALSLPLPAMSELNSRLLRYSIRRYALRRSALTIGKLLPIGIGALIGAVGNRIIGKKIIVNARNAFGAAPTRWPGALRLLPALPADDTEPSPNPPAQHADHRPSS